MSKRLCMILGFIKVNAIYTKIPSTSGLLTKTYYDSDKKGLEKKIEDVDKKISNTNWLVKKITEIENKIPSDYRSVITPAVNAKVIEIIITSLSTNATFSTKTKNKRSKEKS